MEMTKPTVESVKIDNTEATNATQVQPDAVDIQAIKPESKETTKETTEATEVKTDRRHSVVYLAGGIWKDETGVYWCREEMDNCVSSATFTEDELEKRSDIKYMIEYGSMKDIISE